MVVWLRGGRLFTLIVTFLFFTGLLLTFRLLGGDESVRGHSFVVIVDVTSLRHGDVPGVLEIVRAYNHQLAVDAPSDWVDSVRLRFHPVETLPDAPHGHTTVHWTSPTTVQIDYVSINDAVRGLGRVLATPVSQRMGTIQDTRLFSKTGVMLDVSRGAAYTLETHRLLLRRFALMGINVVLLYMEDMYEVPGEELFGYLRGRYSRNELQSLDDYADALGIELVPCIQTLGHLEQVLHWRSFKDVRDTYDVLLVRENETKSLVQKLLEAAHAPFRSTRIHIGFDETEHLGLGKSLKKNGYLDVFRGHLNVVSTLCKQLGLKPMAWSDMIFKWRSPTKEYYDTTLEISEEVIDSIPDNVDLVYWDYYNLDSDVYRGMISKHQSLAEHSPYPRQTVMATGAWCWNRFWSHYPHASQTIDPFMLSAKTHHINEVLITLWGDDGHEVDIRSALPAVHYFAEHSYSVDTVDMAWLRESFRAIHRGDFDEWIAASHLDIHASLSDLAHFNTPVSVAKSLLWEDPLLGHLQADLSDVSDLADHYSTLSSQLALYAQHDPVLRLPAQLGRVLSLKVPFHADVVQSLHSGDVRRLRTILTQKIPDLLREIDVLWRIHRALWLQLYQPFGLEILEHRYGSLRIRLESLRDRLQGCLITGTSDSCLHALSDVVATRHATQWPKDVIGWGDCASPSAFYLIPH